MRNNPEKVYLEMQVEDNGIGISKPDQSKLFQLFGFLESSKQLNTKGIGLGLHITKKITKMFSGDITCCSQVGKGTNFIFLVCLNDNEMMDGLDDFDDSNRILNPQKRIYQRI